MPQKPLGGTYREPLAVSKGLLHMKISKIGATAFHIHICLSHISSVTFVSMSICYMTSYKIIYTQCNDCRFLNFAI